MSDHSGGHPVICRQIRPKLYLMADAELPGEEVRDVATHLLSCPQCKAVYDQLRAENRQLAGTLGVRALSEEEISRLEKQVLHKLAPPRRVALEARPALLLQGIFLIGVILISYAVTLLLRVEPSMLYDQVAKGLQNSHDAWFLAVNLAVALIITLIAAGGSRLTLAYIRIPRGGVLSCSRNQS